jgi:PST family polysaccharide transporter
MTDSLRRNTWVVVAAQAASQLVTLAVLAVLYRRLGVESFGLLGMVTPLLVLVRIFVASGLDVAAIQRPGLSDQQVSALFWINQGLGLAMAAAIAAAAPLLVWFYGKNQLLSLTLALAGTSMVNALGMQHQALLQRRLLLGRLALIRLAALSLGGVAGILAALANGGVWALVAQQYVELGSLAALAWWAEPWRPRLTLGSSAGGLVRFGGYYTLSSLMFYLVGNVDRILVGYTLGAGYLGLYGQARNLMMKPVGIVLTPLTSIMLPALSRAAHDHRLYVRLFLGFSRFIALTMLPAGVGLAIVAPEAMRVLGGQPWAAAGPVLRILALALLVQGFFDALGSVFASVGRSDRLAYASIVIALVLSASFALGLTLGGRRGEPLRGVALGYSISMVLLVFPGYLAFALRTVDVAFRDWLGQLVPAAPAAGVMGLVVALCHRLLGSVWPLPAPMLLAVEILVGVLVYSLLARRDIAWLLRQGLPGHSPKEG